MEHKGSCDDGCCCMPSVAVQSLDELDFQKGLWPAAAEGDLDRIRHLLDRHDVNVRDGYGYTALHYAARAGHLRVVEFLLENGAEVLSTNGGATPAHRAALMGHWEVLEIIMDRDPKCIEQQDDDGDTVLHKAAKGGHLDLCGRLLQTAPPLDHICNKRGLTWSQVVKD